jgi:uncharacterized iron-regulated membrane protein
MARTGKPRLRDVWRTIHLWIGAGLFVVLAPLGLTGSYLVWDDGIDALLHPARHAVSAAHGEPGPGAYVAAAAAAFGGRAVPNQLRMADEAGAPVTVTGLVPGPTAPGQRPASLTAWIDPATARVLDVGNPRQELRGMIHQLHGNLFMAQTGRTVVGWFGLAMLVSCVTGLCIWWPRNNALLLKALRWTRSSSVFSNFHHMAGFWICVPLAALSLSGAYIAWPQAMRALTGQAPARQQNRDGAAAPLAHPQLTADQAVAAALAMQDAPAPLASLTLPTEGDKPAWRVQFKGGAAARVNDANGKARPAPAAPQGPGNGDPIARVMRRLHDGSGYGPAWRAVVTLAGLAPTLLGITGVVVWLGRRRTSKTSV